jgi:hypothetical protein
MTKAQIRDPEDDGQGASPDWHHNINAWGCLADDVVMGTDIARSLHGVTTGGGGHHHGQNHWCQLSCSPACHRARQPQRREDEGWERKRSLSPEGRDHMRVGASVPALANVKLPLLPAVEWPP